MQFKLLSKLVVNAPGKNEGDEETVSMPLSTFLPILRAATYGSPFFNEAYYLAAHPDVAMAIKKREIHSGIEHYARTGYFLDYLPDVVKVDESHYLAENEDVAQAFRKGQIKDLQQHFEARGYAEGRTPFAGYSVWVKL
jgi:hypothetical protein